MFLSSFYILGVNILYELLHEMLQTHFFFNVAGQNISQRFFLCIWEVVQRPNICLYNIIQILDEFVKSYKDIDKPYYANTVAKLCYRLSNTIFYVLPTRCFNTKLTLESQTLSLKVLQPSCTKPKQFSDVIEVP